MPPEWYEIQFIHFSRFYEIFDQSDGSNVASGVPGSMAQLEAKIKTLKAMLKEIKKESEGTCSCATAACNATEDAKKGLTRLYQANSSLKK